MNKKSKLTAILVALTTMNLYNFITPVLAMNPFRFKIKECTNQSDAYKNFPLNPMNLLETLCSSPVSFYDENGNENKIKLSKDIAFSTEKEKAYRKEKCALMGKALTYLNNDYKSNSRSIKIPSKCSYNETMNYIILNYGTTNNDEFNRLAKECILYRLAEYINLPVLFIIKNDNGSPEIRYSVDDSNSLYNKPYDENNINYFLNFPGQESGNFSSSWDSLNVFMIFPKNLTEENQLKWKDVYNIYDYYRGHKNPWASPYYDFLKQYQYKCEKLSTAPLYNISFTKKYTVQNLNKMLGFNN